MTYEEYNVWRNETIIAGGAWFRIEGATDLFFMVLKIGNGTLRFRETKVEIISTRYPPFVLFTVIGATEHPVPCNLHIVPPTLTAGVPITLFELEMGLETT